MPRSPISSSGSDDWRSNSSEENSMSVGRERLWRMRDGSENWGINFSDSIFAFQDQGGEWNQAKGLVWPLLDLQGVTLKAPERIDDSPNFSWWLALLDLLVFGAGWTNVAEDLTKWRRGGYQTNGSPVLEFVKNNWGESVCALEYHLYRHKHSLATITEYARRARGKEVSSRLPESILEDYDRSNVHNTLRFRDSSEGNWGLVSALCLGENQPGENFCESDCGHLAAHFALIWEDKSIHELGPNDIMEVSKNFSIITLESYEGWYSKIHEARKDFENDLDSLIQINTISVHVEGLGYLGTFVYNKALGGFRREGEIGLELAASTTHPPTTSIRFGFELTEDMGKSLALALEYCDSYEDDSVEKLEINVRNEVGLAHTLNYVVSNEGIDDPDFKSYFSRSGDKWLTAFVSTESHQFVTCLAEMAKTGQLDTSLAIEEAVIDGSSLLYSKPWAAPFILKLWDDKSPFHSFYAAISEYERDQMVSIHHLDPEDGRALLAEVEKLTKPRVRAEEQQELQVAISLAAGRDVTADEVLEFFSEY